jgi:hypothetical protein
VHAGSPVGHISARAEEENQMMKGAEKADTNEQVDPAGLGHKIAVM